MNKLIISILLVISFGCAFSVKAEKAKPYYHSCEYKERQTEHTALACNLYFESRDQPLAGQWAVGYVTINRVNHPTRFDNSIIDVVYKYKQFSWTHDGKTDRIYDLDAWMVSLHSATILLKIKPMDYQYMDFTEGSLFYHNNKVSPNWAHKDNLVVVIQDHLFYDDDLKK